MFDAVNLTFLGRGELAERNPEAELWNRAKGTTSITKDKDQKIRADPHEYANQ